MPSVRKIQRKGETLFVRFPKETCTLLDLRMGQYVLIHSLNDRQIIMTLLDDEVPVIQLEKEVTT